MNTVSRRTFLRTSAAAALAATLPSARGQVASAKLKLGLIGCGGRGTGAAAQALTADSNTEMWALGDVFTDAIAKSQQALAAQIPGPGRMNVADDRKFVGL